MPKSVTPENSGAPANGECMSTLPPSAVDLLVRRRPVTVLLVVVLLVLAIAAIDGLLPSNPPLRTLYLLPLALAASVLNRRQIMVAAVGFAALGEQLSRTPWQGEWVEILATYSFVFGLAGLLLRELFAARRAALRFSAQLVAEAGRRQESESQAESLVESMPAAIVVVDSQGIIRLANRGAEALLAVPHGRLVKQPIRRFVPNLAEIAKRGSCADGRRTAANLQARRADGEEFMASAWFSSYAAEDGPCLVVILADASGDLRDFQEKSFQSLLKSTRVLVGSVSHEIRNICAAISFTQSSLGRIPGVAESEAYRGLNSLVRSLTRISSAELPDPGESSLSRVDVKALLEEFRIVMAPALNQESVTLTIDAIDDLPPAAAEHHGLLQVLINLARNSSRAMCGSKVKAIQVAASFNRDRLMIRVSDTGPGVKKPEDLFRAFQPGAESSGLGLFISRALVRSFGGELLHEAGESGCTMLIRLKPWTAGETPESIQSMEINA